MLPPDPSSFQIILDVPLERQGDSVLALNFDHIGRNFAEIIQHSEPRFAVGIFGSWGTGKTTLMKEIERGLNNKDTAVVWFSAWRYEREPHLIVPLLDVIREAIAEWAARSKSKKFKQAANRLAATIGRVSSSMLAGLSFKAGPSQAQVSFDGGKVLTQAATFDEEERAARTPTSLYHSGFTALNKGFKEFQDEGAKRIVVFVDDLDRCLPAGALEVLESMKLFFDLSGFVFVVGLDRQVVQLGLEKRFREMLPQEISNERSELVVRRRADSYLDKIFQVPYSITDATEADLTGLLDTMRASNDLRPIAQQMPTSQVEEIYQVVEPFMRFLVTDAGLNPRMIKRFINSYTIQRKLLHDLPGGVPDTDPRRIVLALQTLRFRPDWEEVQTAILSLRETCLTAIQELQVNADATSFSGMVRSSSRPPPSFMEFVKPGNPGNVLIEYANRGPEFNQYIELGERSFSRDGSLFAALFSGVGALNKEIWNFKNQGKGIDQAIRDIELDTSLAITSSSSSEVIAVREAGQEIEDITEQIRRLGSEYFDKDINNTFAALSEDGRAYLASLEKRIENLQDDLQSAYRTT